MGVSEAQKGGVDERKSTRPPRFVLKGPMITCSPTPPQPMRCLPGCPCGKPSWKDSARVEQIGLQTANLCPAVFQLRTGPSSYNGPAAISTSSQSIEHAPKMDHGSHDMDVTSTSTGAMASSTSSMDMDMGGHGHGGMKMDMSDMAMTFFTSSDTPLYSGDWTPSNAGHYAGTCIFLIALGLTLRVLLALRPILEQRLWSKTAAAAAAAASIKSLEESGGEGAVAAGQPRQALAAVAMDARRRWSGWRVGTAASRATYELVIAGVGYLL